MATSSSDDSCSAPTDFNIFSSLEELNSRCSIGSEKCPLCIQSRKSFVCLDCVRQGDFIHSSSRYPERYAEKKLRLFKNKKERLKCLDSINEIYSRKAHVSQLKSELRCARENLTCLRLAVDESKDTLQRSKDEISSFQDQIRTYRKRAPLLDGKYKKLVSCSDKLQTETNKLNETLQRNHEDAKRIIRTHIEQLVTYIFPIREIRPNKSETDSSTEDTVTALAEATRTTYVHGRWVYADNVCDVRYQIVEALLPASGDYSDYCAWVITNKDAVPGTEVAHKNPAYAITAGLTYTTQLVSILAYYMDVNLPHQICYSDFCGHELGKGKFTQKVAKLNANVLHLCLSQRVNAELLHPKQTIHNLLLLLSAESCDFGRPGAYIVETDQLNSMEDSLASDLNISISSEDEDEEIAEWEKIHNISCEEVTIPTRAGFSTTPGMHSHTIIRQNTHPQTAASATPGVGLVTSAMGAVTSWWRANWK